MRGAARGVPARAVGRIFRHVHTIKARLLCRVEDYARSRMSSRRCDAVGWDASLLTMRASA